MQNCLILSFVPLLVIVLRVFASIVWYCRWHLLPLPVFEATESSAIWRWNFVHISLVATLLVTKTLSHITYRLSPIAYRPSPIAYRLSPIAHCPLPITCRLSTIAYCLSPIACRLSAIAYQLITQCGLFGRIWIRYLYLLNNGLYYG